MIVPVVIRPALARHVETLTTTRPDSLVFTRVVNYQHEKRPVILSLGYSGSAQDTSVACVRADQVSVDQASVCTCDQPS